VDRRSAPAAGEGARIAADALLVAHFLLAVFIAGGLPVVWLGAAAGWRWVRNVWFRSLHLAAIAIVALESVLGIACPLTIWEDLLRGSLQPQSFVGRWVHRLLYYNVPERLFTLLYAVWALATLVTLVLVPPRKKAA
jgi:polyferredoxin